MIDSVGTFFAECDDETPARLGVSASRARVLSAASLRVFDPILRRGCDPGVEIGINKRRRCPDA